MRRYTGMLVFGASAILAIAAYVTLVIPVRSDIGRLVETILEDQVVSAAELENRLENTPSAEDEALLGLRQELAEKLPALRDPWIAHGRKSPPDTTAFKGFFESWHARMLERGFLDPRAWPKTAWRNTPALPSTSQRESTARVMLLVEGLGRALRQNVGVPILRVRPEGTSGEASIEFEFDPDDWGRVLEVLLEPVLRGESYTVLFEIRDLTVNVPESGDATALVHLALDEPE